jgi:arsenate reductase
MKPKKPRFRILFLCTGNSARSIFAEYLLRQAAPIRFETYSAGSSPKPAPHPLALEVLRQDFKIDASDAHSKSWEEFTDAQFDFVITLCDNAKESCPVWPGQPVIAHWSSPFGSGDPGDRPARKDSRLEIKCRRDSQRQSI